MLIKNASTWCTLAEAAVAVDVAHFRNTAVKFLSWTKSGTRTEEHFLSFFWFTIHNITSGLNFLAVGDDNVNNY